MTPQTVRTPSPSAAQRKTAPEMPRIPGVPNVPTRRGLQIKPLIAVIAAALVCIAGFAFWLSHGRTKELGTSASSEPAASVARPVDGPPNLEPATEPNTVGTLYELAAPWSSKAFFFSDAKNHLSVPAIVIHLPSPPAEPAFWAFALTNPLSRCQLEYVTDLSAISLRFAYPAAHPMVVSDCDGILYDPLKMATLADGTWVRGDIVRGVGIRPPLAIEVEVRGRDVIAKRME